MFMGLSGQHAHLATLTLLFFFLLLLCGDVESNPGPPLKSLSAFHCNINSLYAHNNDHKLGELEILADLTHSDIIALTETWLDDTISDQLLSIRGFLPP